MKSKSSLITFCLTFASLIVGSASAQTAGAGAEHNKAEREKAQENARLERVDPPIRPDPLGNALIGGAVTGTMKGAAAGAVSAARGGAIGSTVQATKDSIKENKAENAKTGRGRENDPRYDPRSLGQ